MKLALLIGCLALSACSNKLLERTTPEPAKARQVYILAGQSNMSGDVAHEMSLAYASDQRVTMKKNGEWLPAHEPTNQRPYAGFSPGMPFAVELLRLNPSQEIGIINCAVGGTAISYWQPGDNGLEHCIGQFRPEDGQLAGILFMQGEADAMLGTPDWDVQFRSLARYLRSRFGNIPIVYGQIGKIQFSDPHYEPFRAQQAGAQDTHTPMISTDDLPMRDSYHFTREGLIELGKRMARAMYDVKHPEANSILGFKF